MLRFSGLCAFHAAGLVVLVLGVALGAVQARGATLLVPEDHASVGGAAAVAVAGDTILVAAGTYREYGIMLAPGVALLGRTGDRADVVIDAGSAGTGIAVVGADGRTTIADLSVHWGNPGLGCDGADVVVRNCAFVGGLLSAGRNRGIALAGSAATFYRCEIRAHDSFIPGAAIAATGSRAVLRECRILDNRYEFLLEPIAEVVGGVVLIDAGSDAAFHACLLQGNITPGWGTLGVVGATATMDSCTVRAEAANGRYGGAVHVASDGTLAVRDCFFGGNSPGSGSGSRYGYWGGEGGAIYALGGLEVTGTVFVANFAPAGLVDPEVNAGRGGAIRAAAPDRPAVVSRCVFYANSAAEGSAVNGDAALDHSILAISIRGRPVADERTSLRCCNLWGNAGGDWVGGIADLLGVDGNIRLDPLFCAPQDGNFQVRADSPCLPGNLPGGCDGIIGAFGAGCAPRTPVPADVTTFRAALVADGVALLWRLTADLPVADLRLVASGGSKREVSLVRVDAGQYTAIDPEAALQVGATVNYSLQRRLWEESWTVLAKRTFTVPERSAATSLGPIAPNPFNPQASIAFTLARPGRATITVHDLAGRLIAVLADREWSAGPHDITWQGRDRHGRSAASGTYIVRLAAGDAVDTRQVTLIR